MKILRHQNDQECLQFTRCITKPAIFEALEDITFRTMMTSQQEDNGQQIRQFLGVLFDPTRYCFKTWKAKGSKLRAT